jgi:WS/DGAT/MGAT family acyltransferase
MTTQLSHRLTATDAAFLYAETPHQPLHVGGVLEYDGYISRDEVIEGLRNRMHLMPRYRQRVVFPPFGLAHPTWEDDPDFDVANHIEEITLPAPGDDRVLSEVGGRVFAKPLDRSRPLWKLVLLQGRPGGTTAILSMVHHAMVDGVSSVELTMVMHDLTPDAPPVVAEPWHPRPLPDVFTQIEDAVRDQLADAVMRWTNNNFAFLHPDRVARQWRSLLGAVATVGPATQTPAPRVPFNRMLSGERQFAWTDFGLPQVRFIKSALGGTVNDAVLTIVSGALGRYLRAHDVDTRGMVLRAMCPVSMRDEDHRTSLGNLVSIILAPLYVDIVDPVERFKAERAEMERAKQLDEAGGLFALTANAQTAPPALAATFMPMMAPFVAPFPNNVLNTVSTNVPGPQVPLYLKGRQLVSIHPLGPLSGGIGLFQAIVSYNRKITIGTIVDPKLVPDVWFYADCLKQSFGEMLEAAVATTTAAGGEIPAEVKEQGRPAPAPAKSPSSVLAR